MPLVEPRLCEPRPLKRLGLDWHQAIPVITLSRVVREIAGGPVRLDGGRLYCLPPVIARELLDNGLAIPGEPEDIPV